MYKLVAADIMLRVALRSAALASHPGGSKNSSGRYWKPEINADFLPGLLGSYADFLNQQTSASVRKCDVTIWLAVRRDNKNQEIFIIKQKYQ